MPAINRRSLITMVGIPAALSAQSRSANSKVVLAPTVGTIWNARKDVFRDRHRQLGYFNLQELLDSGAGVVPVSVGDVQRI
jgi:hypothetical protein